MWSFTPPVVHTQADAEALPLPMVEARLASSLAASVAAAERALRRRVFGGGAGGGG